MSEEGYFSEAQYTAQDKYTEISLKKTLAPAVDPGNDGGEPQTQHA
jgi:hypothetical protein